MRVNISCSGRRIRTIHHRGPSDLISQVPDADGPVVTSGDEDVFERVSGQTPDPPLSVSVDHGVGGSVLLSNLDDLAVFGPNQDLTLHHQRGKQTRQMFQVSQIVVTTWFGSYLPSADGAHVLHRLAGLQLKRSTSLHLLVPKLHSSALFSPANADITGTFSC